MVGLAPEFLNHFHRYTIKRIYHLNVFNLAFNYNNIRVELLRLTQKLHFKLTHFHCNIKVDTKDSALCWQKMTLVFMSTLNIALSVEISHLLAVLAYVFKVDKENLVYKVDIANIMHVYIKTQVNFGRHRSLSSKSTLRLYST